MERIEPTFSAPSANRSRQSRVINCGMLKPVMWFFMSFFMFLFSAACIFGVSFLCYRGWHPITEPTDFFLSALAIAGITAVIYITHSGHNVIYGIMAIYPILRFADKNNEEKSAVSTLFSNHIFSVLFLSMFLYGILFMLLYSMHKILQCFSVLATFDEEGLLIPYVSGKKIPWTAVQHVEEFEKYKKPAFRLSIDNMYKLFPRFLWSMYEKDPILATYDLDINPFELREILSSRGECLKPA